MPLFEFRCNECHYIFEQIVTLYDPLVDCPLCSGETTRMMSHPAVHFKGKGFYSTDYGKRKYD